MDLIKNSEAVTSIYTPLDKATRSIRLLRFAEPPPDSADNLHFTLAVHSLLTEDEQALEDDQCTRFIALSCVWGDIIPDCSIIVNGKRLCMLCSKSFIPNSRPQ